jgi:Flp pilus assembly protein TadD
MPSPCAVLPALGRRCSGAPVVATLAALLLAACQGAGPAPPAPPSQLSLQARLRLAEATDAQQGGTAATYAVLAEAAATAPDDIPLQERFAAVAEANERWAEAAEALRRIIARAPTPERLMRLGRLELRLGQPSAVQTWQRAVASGGRSVEALNGLGLAHDMVGDHAAAQAAYRQALAIDPASWTVAANLGMSLLLTRQPKAAAEVLARAEADPAAPPRARHNLAIAFAMSGQEARMLRLLRAEGGRTPQQLEALAAEIRDFARWLATRDGPAPAPTPPPEAGAPAPAPAAAEAAPAFAPAARPAAPPSPALAARSQPASAPMAGAAPPPGPPHHPHPAMPPPPSDAPAAAADGAATRTTAAASLPAANQEMAADTPPLSLASGGALVQLAALDSEAAAQRQWAVLVARVPELGAHEPSVERIVTNGRPRWRLRIRGLADLAAANALCARVRAAGSPCFAAPSAAR